MSYAIAREPASLEMLNECHGILEQNFLEHEVFTQDLPLEVNIAYYVELERRGYLRTYVARREGVFVGYCVLTVTPSSRRRALEANALLVDALLEHRGRVVPMLVRHAERALRAEGVHLVYHSCPIGGRFGQLLEILDYRPAFQVYAKRLR